MKIGEENILWGNFQQTNRIKPKKNPKQPDSKEKSLANDQVSLSASKSSQDSSLKIYSRFLPKDRSAKSLAMDQQSPEQRLGNQNRASLLQKGIESELTNASNPASDEKQNAHAANSENARPTAEGGVGNEAAENVKAYASAKVAEVKENIQRGVYDEYDFVSSFAEFLLDNLIEKNE